MTAALHRNFGLFTLLLLAVHIATSVLDPFAGIRPADAVIPFAGAYRTFWLGLGVIAAEVLVAVTVTSLLRGRIGPRVWKLIHWATYASWPIALAHGLGTGSDAQTPWMLGLTAACMAAVMLALARRLLAGRLRTAPVRLGAAGVAVVTTYALCSWAVSGPLQPGWAVKAGTPHSILSSASSTHLNSINSQRVRRPGDRHRHEDGGQRGGCAAGHGRHKHHRRDHGARTDADPAGDDGRAQWQNGLR